MNLKKYFENIVSKTILELINQNKLGQMKISDEFSINCEIPKNDEFGDFAINISSLARYAKISPVQIANLIKDTINENGFKINVVAGFINFKLEYEFLNKIIIDILNQKENYAQNNYGNNQKVNLEYVSANPTGPFHIGHGRWAAMGSALANLMKYSGYDVFQEFYINDAGSQIEKLGKSLLIRIKQQLGEKIDFPSDELEAKNYYQGEYLIPVAKKFLTENSAENLDLNLISDYAKKEMLKSQQKLLKDFGVNFDNFFSELSLHKSGEVDSAIEKLKKSEMLYENDGALWFRSTKYGDEKDRVLKKSDGKNTYLTADIAYHYNKLERGFSKLINIWGADHHGYVARLRASIQALGHNPDSLEVLLGQLVNLVFNGEAVRMGKRSKMLTLDELIDEVGVDATRFWMIMRSIDTTLDFDVELAKSKTDENPVFYVQYAHARACSIFRNTTEERFDSIENKKLPPIFDTQELQNEISKVNLENLWKENEKSVNSTKKLILKLEEYKFLIENATKYRAPYMICNYVQELAGLFHQFYTLNRVIVDDKQIMISRLALIQSFRYILKSALDILGVSAPEKM